MQCCKRNVEIWILNAINTDDEMQMLDIADRCSCVYTKCVNTCVLFVDVVRMLCLYAILPVYSLETK